MLLERILNPWTSILNLIVVKGKEQSRRDDLLALSNMFYHFISGGSLPWAGIKDDDRQIRYHKVFTIKEQTDLSMVGRGHPREFEIYTR